MKTARSKSIVRGAQDQRYSARGASPLRRQDASRRPLQGASAYEQEPGAWPMPNAWRPFKRRADQEAGKATNRRRAGRNARPMGKLRAEGKTSVELSPDGRQRLREAARRTMRMRHRKRQALEWSNWMLRQQADWTIRMWADDRRRVILHPYLQTLKDYGDEAFFELAEIAGFGDLRKTSDGTELTAKILSRYMPRLDICVAAADLRKGAESS